MFALYCNATSYLARVLAAFPVHQHVLVTNVWRRFEQSMSTVTGGVVVLPWLSDETFSGLCALTARHGGWPLVLVTTREADNARHLKDVAVREVVWLHEVERELWRAVQRVVSRPTFDAVATLIEGLDGLPLILREALAHACRTRTPVRSVAELARATSCCRSTLWYHWNRVMHTDPPLRLEDFLDWLLVLHALGRKRPDCAWPRVAEELGVHERTLGRLARRLTGRPLGDLNRSGQAVVTALFRERMLQPLLAQRGRTFCANFGRFAVAKE